MGEAAESVRELGAYSGGAISGVAGEGGRRCGRGALPRAAFGQSHEPYKGGTNEAGGEGRGD